MKKINKVFLIILCNLLLISSCTSKVRDNIYSNHTKKEYIGNGIYKCTVENHEYLSSRGYSLIHSESCPCKRR